MQVPITRLPRVAASVAKYCGPFLYKFMLMKMDNCVYMESCGHHMFYSELTGHFKLTSGLVLVYWPLRSSLKTVLSGLLLKY